MYNPHQQLGMTPLWSAVDTTIAAYQPKHTQAHENGLHLARIVQGLMGDHNTDPHDIGPYAASKEVYAAFARHKPHFYCRDIVAFMVSSWKSVFAPVGYTPVQWAVKRVGWKGQQQPVEGDFADPLLATTLWHVYQYLPVNDAGATGASSRQLAAALNSNRNLIANAVNELCAAGYLVLHTAHTTTLYARYIVQSVPVVFQLYPVDKRGQERA